MDLSLLYKLCELCGVSGDETDVSDYIINLISDSVDEIYKDNIGNVYAYKYGFGDTKKTIMLCAHTDEVGLVVSSITDDGYLKFRTMGGIDENVLLSKRVYVGKNKVLGVTGVKAVHLMSPEKRNQKILYNEMYIDIGAESKDEAENMVKTGDPVYFCTESETVGECVKAKALDDRVGCFVLVEVLKKQYKDDVCVCFTTQEEVGLRGAKVAARRIKPDVCIVVEGTTCLDLPNIDKSKISTKLGDGVTVTIADGAAFPSTELRNVLSEISPKCQFKNICSGGNDSGTIMLQDVKTQALSIPARYIHSPASMVSPEDIKNCIITIQNFLERGLD